MILMLVRICSNVGVILLGSFRIRGWFRCFLIAFITTGVIRIGSSRIRRRSLWVKSFINYEYILTNLSRYISLDI